MNSKALLLVFILGTLFACKKSDKKTPDPVYPMGNPHQLNFELTDTMSVYKRDSSSVFVIDTLFRGKKITSQTYPVIIDTYSNYAVYKSDTFYKSGNSFIKNAYNGISRGIISFANDSVVIQQQIDTLPAGSYHNSILKGFGIFIVY
jgi:hypothetical protein